MTGDIMKIFDLNGKKTAVINIFIDPQHGFLDLGMDDRSGGVLYVPEGERVAPLMGSIVAQSRGSIFILGQDYHPKNHISFMVNHPGLMADRVARFGEFLRRHGQPAMADKAALERAAQQPVHFFNGFDQPPAAFPFDEIVLDEKRNIMGLKEADGRIRKVRVETASGLAPDEKDRGRVTEVLDGYYGQTFDEYRAQGRLLSTQTLWIIHCVQGTQSSLYPAELNLPAGLTGKIEGDLMSPYIHHRDAATGNEFFVIRKGANSEVDSYGIGVENDGKTLTKAWEVFGDIAESLKAQGCEQVLIHCGGLATNFCTEFSLNNVADFLAGHFKMRGMTAQIDFVPEISRGIPVPGGAETPFSLAGTPARLQQRGIGTASVAAILGLQQARPPKAKAAFRP